MSVFNDERNLDFALVTVSDITNLRRYEKQKKIEEIKSIYFASLAHDLRTPINSIMGSNQYL